MLQCTCGGGTCMLWCTCGGGARACCGVHVEAGLVHAAVYMWGGTCMLQYTCGGGTCLLQCTHEGSTCMLQCIHSESTCMLRCTRGGSTCMLWYTRGGQKADLFSEFFPLTLCESWKLNSNCQAYMTSALVQKAISQPSFMFFCMSGQLIHATCNCSTYILFLMSIFLNCQF